MNEKKKKKKMRKRMKKIEKIHNHDHKQERGIINKHKHTVKEEEITMYPKPMKKIKIIINQHRLIVMIIIADRIPPANPSAVASVRMATSSVSTCVCVSRRVATIGRPERRYW